MAKATFYYHLQRLGTDDGYGETRERIRRLFEQHHRRYGYRRVTLELRNQGLIVNHKTVNKLMRQMGLKALRTPRRFRTYKGEVGKIAPNALGRDFKASEPNRKWATDVTQVMINDVKVFLSPIMDMYNGEIVTYTLSYSPNLRMVTDMVHKAIRKVHPEEGLVLHSDQGWHYQHAMYQMLLKSNGITQSMSRKGNCLDNAMMENFFGLMKTELLYAREWSNIVEFTKELKKYIKYYNNVRIKLRLNGKSPVQYRTLNKKNN